MTTTRTWTVQISLTEQHGRTQADAALHGSARDDLHGTGQARLHPGESDVPEIGDEVAAARALSELAHRLFDAAAENIQAAMAGPDRTM
ncbi:hypothetical protein CcI156_05120 [Frankia sp. CcI156]|uniref:DUF1876 domain-containing protein n=1 Tax=Frankia casuarinae (strain DSM 45818 / CECT 9043 / HFP020203 / CcI3) TaxID=106370 RepID=Q2JCQ7_FRACC|nr:MULTISPECIES: DUF1876 domain-containing protein [Frankia]ABD10935.1 conserved hypothetical protein [Frankia casuarinae]ETA02214.1 hypothetical protein CcI6DRAFT_02389 [Frankia sp. CcI6]EYT92379.1 hypothetical protein ThrDRAFT_01989 [Frankia casuarinae]KDA42897.1 hypothetical protein BMG523Draft_02286 [Frankia sp. BMG5.23]KEZ37547.1 protein of unknown function (DUF1876) [Frankia sp. CeD]